MTNILVDQLPDAVLIDGEAVSIVTDFRACLKVIMACEDDELTLSEKASVLLDNLYPDLPDNQDEAYRMGVKFLDGGKEGDDDGESHPRVFSFAKDANFIFAAFKQTHGIDLQDTEYLHWWKFLALFMDLGGETTFCSLVNLRSRVKSGKATKEEKEAARKMGDVFTLPEIDDRTPEEKQAERDFFRMIDAAKETA
jgi:hypothetical protein